MLRQAGQQHARVSNGRTQPRLPLMSGVDVIGRVEGVPIGFGIGRGRQRLTREVGGESPHPLDEDLHPPLTLTRRREWVRQKIVLRRIGDKQIIEAGVMGVGHGTVFPLQEC